MAYTLATIYPVINSCRHLLVPLPPTTVAPLQPQILHVITFIISTLSCELPFIISGKQEIAEWKEKVKTHSSWEGISHRLRPPLQRTHTHSLLHNAKPASEQTYVCYTLYHTHTHDDSLVHQHPHTPTQLLKNYEC